MPAGGEEPDTIFLCFWSRVGSGVGWAINVHVHMHNILMVRRCFFLHLHTTKGWGGCGGAGGLLKFTFACAPS